MSYPFGYWKGILYIGPELSCHEDINQYNNLHKFVDREILDYAGRLWTDKKIIYFWNYPPKEMMPDFLEEMQEIFDKEQIIETINDEWFIEVPIDENTERGYYDLLKQKTKLIKIKDFLKSDEEIGKWSEEEMNVIHNLPPEQKAKKLKELGYKPKHIKTPQGMSQAEYRNKITKYKYTESADGLMYKNKVILYDDALTFPFIVSDKKNINGKHNADVGKEGKTHGTVSEVGNINGRIFLEQKIISFWQLQSKDFVDILKSVQEKFNEKDYRSHVEKYLPIDFFDGDWKIDIHNSEYKNKFNDDLSKWGGEIYTLDRWRTGDKGVLIPLLNFIKMTGGVVNIERDEEVYNQHLLSWAEKDKLKKPKGWGSDLKARKNPLAWEQAKRTSESKR
jgi:hypothetical protein